MRILHLSHGGLPDWRIEKSAISLLKFGHEAMFGGAKSINYKTNIFSKIYEINWSDSAKFGIPFYWHSVRKQFERVLRESRPDVVHAHNIFSAKMLSEFEIPFVYDDHEFTSAYVRGLSESVKINANHKRCRPELNSPTFIDRVNKSARRFAWNALMKYCAVKLWSEWEKKLLSLACPIIVTTNAVAFELRKLYNETSTIFIVPNFPMKNETKCFLKPRALDNFSSVYTGIEGLHSSGVLAHRDMTGLIDLFVNDNIGQIVLIGVNGNSSSRVKYLGFMNRESMYDEMSNHSIGLMAFRKHWSHRFKSPNKAYEYAHAGLYVICTSSFSSVIQSFNGNCAVFEDYNDLKFRLRYLRDNPDELYKKRLESFLYAKSNLIWEKYEKNIFEAYKSC